MSDGKQPLDDQVKAFAATTLGGVVVACERQPRWRPAWFLTVERDGEAIPLYFRGDRGIGEGGAYALEHEMACLEVLHAHGIPVPKVYGFCDAPRGILMDRSPGRSDLSTAVDETERHAVQTHYMEILADVHRLDVAPFEAAGLTRPASKHAAALADFPIWERGYRQAKIRPEPLIEFGIRWLERNVPEQGDALSFVCADSGQFMFEDGRVTALLDLELAHLGHPAEDLAGLRTRDLSEPLGDLRQAVATYERITGAEIDRRLIDYHTVRFALVTPLAVARLVATPLRGIDLVQYLSWYHVYGRTPIEVIARMQGVPLEAPPVPEAEPTRHSVAHDALVLNLEPGEGADRFSEYETDTALRIAEYLRRAERHGPALEADDRAELATLLGAAGDGFEDADRRLEELVLEAGPERDADLLRYFYRRTLRQEALLAPAMRELEGVRVQMLD